MSTIIRIKKEELPSVHFGHEDVHQDEFSRDLRQKQLIYALFLGNAEKQKVAIYFDDAQGETYEVKATVWGLGDNHVSIKYGYTIPVAAIRELIF